MVATIRDMIFVKNLERRLGRELTEQELSGEEFEARFPDGHREFIQIPILEFPKELLSSPAFYICENQEYVE